jgi:AraC-like DNA-binding protein
MAYHNKNNLEKEAAIKDRFEKLYAKEGHRWKHSYIIEQVAKQFFVSPRTVSAILNGEYDRNRNARKPKLDPAQLSIFN